MAEAKYDVLGIGNAIFDVLVQTDEKFLSRHGMTKGGMALIDEARAASIYRDMGPATKMSGGSAANTIVGIASLGARAAYVGKVRDDEVGRLYTHDIRAAQFEMQKLYDAAYHANEDAQAALLEAMRQRDVGLDDG